MLEAGRFQADADELIEVAWADPDRQAAHIGRLEVDIADADAHHFGAVFVGVERAKRLAERLAQAVARIRTRGHGMNELDRARVKSAGWIRRRADDTLH